MDMMEIRHRVMAGQKKSGAVETYLCQNYSPNGSKFSYAIDGINLSDGDYIEISADTSNCYKNNENIISVGANIGSWSGNHFHCYYTQSSHTLQLSAVTANTNIVLSNSTTVIRIDKDGIACDGIYWDKSKYTNTINNLIRMSTIYVGSQEGSNRFYGTYNYIKWVKA